MSANITKTILQLLTTPSTLQNPGEAENTKKENAKFINSLNESRLKLLETKISNDQIKEALQRLFALRNNRNYTDGYYIDEAQRKRTIGRILAYEGTDPVGILLKVTVLEEGNYNRVKNAVLQMKGPENKEIRDIVTAQNQIDNKSSAPVVPVSQGNVAKLRERMPILSKQPSADVQPKLKEMAAAPVPSPAPVQEKPAPVMPKVVNESPKSIDQVKPKVDITSLNKLRDDMDKYLKDPKKQAGFFTISFGRGTGGVSVDLLGKRKIAQEIINQVDNIIALNTVNPERAQENIDNSQIGLKAALKEFLNDDKNKYSSKWSKEGTISTSIINALDKLDPTFNKVLDNPWNKSKETTKENTNDTSPEKPTTKGSSNKM